MIKDALLATAGSDSSGLLSPDRRLGFSGEAGSGWNNMRGAWLLQTAQQLRYCLPLGDCQSDRLQLTLVLLVLLSAIFSMLCAFAFFREDKEDITPLTPQLMVREAEMVVNLTLNAQDDNFAITKEDGEVVASVAIEWPDPFRPGCGVAGQVRIFNSQQVLGIVSARSVLNTFGQAPHGLALCREKHEMFAWVEVEGTRSYHVRHRTSQPLLTLVGDLTPGGTIDMEGYNPVGFKVCSLKNGKCKVTQHFDAGMVFLSILAIHLHRRLQDMKPSLPAPIPQGEDNQPAPGHAEAQDETVSAALAAGPEEEALVAASAAPRS